MSLQNTLFPWQKEWLWPDLIAAFVVTVLLIPQAIAYAFLAGLPPQTGLFASLLPLMAYAILGRSPSMALGPVAIISLMTIGTLADVSIPSAESYPAYAALLAGLCGAWLLVFFVAGLGTWTSFISHSVISGFTSAAAIVIIISQLKFLTGIDIPRGGSGWQPLVTIFEQWRDINLTTLAISIGALVLLLVWRLWAPRFSANLPNMLASLVRNSGALVVIVLAVSATLFWSLPVQVVGQIPTGLPHFVLPEFNQLNWRELIVPSGVMALIIYLESLAIANALAR
ncbi:MAG: SulP family inorganic anion transporter, partial [Oleibacter sp.]|nr:SulP family inorganic anion transporter [Thalassolituus sp.]